MKTITLNIAGEKFNVLFDGEKVTSEFFPEEPIEYVALCGTHVSQEVLVEICKNKLNP